MNDDRAHHRCTWEEAIGILREDPRHRQFIFEAYLTPDLLGNCERFYRGAEFAEVLELLREYVGEAASLLDIPAGNGIATFAFSKAGYAVTAVEPDASASVGRGAIKTVIDHCGLAVQVVDAVGENLPFDDESFDVVYVRQGLHHARDLTAMVRQLSRVLKPKGILLAAREHVVDDYGPSLRAFLESQVDHQLYGGENAFTLEDYRRAFENASLRIVREYGPYDCSINLYPNDSESLKRKIFSSPAGRLLAGFLPQHLVVRMGMWRLRSGNRPGRLFTFLARKSG